MIDLLKDGLQQSNIAKLLNVSVATINRYITNNSYIPLNTGVYRNQRYSINDTRKIIQSILSESYKKIIKSKIAFYNFKGGTGKTSICYQVASHFALMGFNVLLIDTDPQGHLSTTCGFKSDSSLFTLYDLIIDKHHLDDVKKTIFPGFDCIPSNLSLTRLEVELNKLPRREERMLMSFQDIEKKYDFIFIDTNPTISLLNRNVVTFCDVINVVCETQPYSLNGLKLLFDDLKKFYHYMDINEKEFHVIPNKYEDRSSSSAEAMTALRDYYMEYIQKDYAIRKSEDINTAAKIGKPLSLFAKKNSIALADIIELVHYLLKKYST